MLRLRREYVASSAARDVVDMGIRRASGRVVHVSNFFFFQAEDGIRDVAVTGVQTCALPISFIIRNADRSQLEKAAKDLGIKLHSTNATLSVKTHPLATPRIALVHNWQNTQNDGWFRISMDELKVPYTYVADTWLRETQNLREKFDVIILPPMGGGGSAGLSALLRGLPLRGDPRPWKSSPETPNFVAPGLDSTDDIRGGLGYQ